MRLDRSGGPCTPDEHTRACCPFPPGEARATPLEARLAATSHTGATGCRLLTSIAGRPRVGGPKPVAIPSRGLEELSARASHGLQPRLDRVGHHGDLALGDAVVPGVVLPPSERGHNVGDALAGLVGDDAGVVCEGQ